MNGLQILGTSGGIAIAIASLWVLRWARRGIRGEAGDQAASHPAGSSAVIGSGPTRLTVGVAGLLVGYHLVCWSLPALSFGVPLDQWWIVVAGAGLAVVGAVAVDVLEAGDAPRDER